MIEALIPRAMANAKEVDIDEEPIFYAPSSSDSYGTENNLIELVENIFGYLFLEGDTLGTLTDDLGAPLGYTFTVESLGEQATITVSAK